MNFTTIQTDRIQLRKFREDDIENVFKGLSHPDVIKYYGISFSSLESTRAQMEFFRNLEENKTGLWLAICSEDNQTFYGAVGLNNRNHVHKKAELGFWLLPAYWGKGIIHEAVPLICEYGFREMMLHRIEAMVETENIKSKNALLKLKFEHEGTLKDCEIKNSRYISLDIFAKLNHE